MGEEVDLVLVKRTSVGHLEEVFGRFHAGGFTTGEDQRGKGHCDEAYRPCINMEKAGWMKEEVEVCRFQFSTAS